jgi:hypothetical protein
MARRLALLAPALVLTALLHAPGAAGWRSGAAPAPRVQRAAYTTAALDLTSPCIPAPGTSACDAIRLRLWSGEPEAWRLLFRALDAPPPSPDRVFEEVVRLRLEAGDPALLAALAVRLGQPYVKVTAIRFRGTEPGQPDEYVEVANLGGAAQDLTGWRLKAGGSGAEFRFRPGTVLGPGDRCRAYTNETRGDSCPGFGFGATFGLWDDDADTVALLAESPPALIDRNYYYADPDVQPPPPALRGTVLESR